MVCATRVWGRWREGRTVSRPKGEPPKLAWSRCKAKSLPRGWLGWKRSGGYILLHARHPMDLTPWCSWLSRQPNMLKVSGSNPDGVMLFLFLLSLPPSLPLCPSLSLSLSFSLSPLAGSPATAARKRAAMLFRTSTWCETTSVLCLTAPTPETWGSRPVSHRSTMTPTHPQRPRSLPS